jgi:hypothetical protein
MIYATDWEMLERALQRVVSAHGNLAESKAAICGAVADKKIEVRVTVDLAHLHRGGATFSGCSVDVPLRLDPKDFDWEMSRPLRLWFIGTQRSEHGHSTGGLGTFADRLDGATKS